MTIFFPQPEGEVGSEGTVDDGALPSGWTKL